MSFWKKKNSITKGDWVKIEHSGQDAFVQLSGKLDKTLSKKLRGSLEALIKQYDDNKIIVNLSRVYLIDTTIAATLAEIARQAQSRKTQLLIVDASSPVQKVFTDLGIENLLSEA